MDEQTGALRVREAPDPDVERKLHQTIAKVTGDIERLVFNTALAALMELVNAATSTGGLTRDQLERFVLLLSPFAPHFAEELWSRLGHERTLACEPWPRFDEAMTIHEQIELPVQTNRYRPPRPRPASRSLRENQLSYQ